MQIWAKLELSLGKNRKWRETEIDIRSHPSCPCNFSQAAPCPVEAWFLLYFACVSDHLLRRQEFPGAPLWVWQGLFGFPHWLEPLQFYPCGGGCLGCLWAAKLCREHVRDDSWGISWISTVDGPKWPRQLMQIYSASKSDISFLSV